MTEQNLLQLLIDQARQAQLGIERCNQAEIDKFVRAIGKVVYDNAEMLSQEAVEETGMGVYEGC